jgi:hypothetical protein
MCMNGHLFRLTHPRTTSAAFGSANHLLNLKERSDPSSAMQSLRGTETAELLCSQGDTKATNDHPHSLREEGDLTVLIPYKKN